MKGNPFAMKSFASGPRIVVEVPSLFLKITFHETVNTWIRSSFASEIPETLPQVRLVAMTMLLAW
jgi:hypothetical protein